MKRLTVADVAMGMDLPELVFTVSATRLVAGALASRDYSPLHHDRRYVVDVAGQRDIFANTQFQAALFERYLNDWSGPMGRTVQMRFAMRVSVFAEDEVAIHGTVEDVLQDGPCGPCVKVTLNMTVDGRIVTTCDALYALPADEADNPWDRGGERWLQPA
ncbi:hypothetical protein MB02_03030 [Croceicoccus estronivorus]|uniref:hypothetical protein n=1 Tax=Croceicoccus estronivorus TaxID=1172626 RepID=UPI0008347AA8|nr:hypothetical protein [Croceicoccus estronivorus]OCC25617.1 hypothetical protein MB02_03030 [Croceicoccus estronivorus]